MTMYTMYIKLAKDPNNSISDLDMWAIVENSSFREIAYCPRVADAELIKELLVYYGEREASAQELVAEVSRLRAENAALRELARQVADMDIGLSGTGKITLSTTVLDMRERARALLAGQEASR